MSSFLAQVAYATYGRQAHYEELKVARDSAEHLSDETGRQLSRVEKQLKEAQEALSSTSHEVCSVTCLAYCSNSMYPG